MKNDFIISVVSLSLTNLVSRIEIHNDLNTIRLFDEQTCISIYWLNDDYSVVIIDSQTGELIRDYGIVSEQTTLNIIDGWMQRPPLINTERKITMKKKYMKAAENALILLALWGMVLVQFLNALGN